jgi:hypothetical protein
MFMRQLRSFVCKSVFSAAIITMAPALSAQNALTALPGSTAFEALPAAVSPAVSSVSAVPASYSAQTFSAIHIPETDSTKPVRQTAVETLPSRRNWLMLSAVSSSAAAIDAYSTRRSITAGNVEADPTMKPFANSPAIYAATQASPLVMDYVAMKMQRSRNLFVRRMWWLPQTTGTAMSLFAGAHNLSLASR